MRKLILGDTFLNVFLLLFLLQVLVFVDDLITHASHDLFYFLRAEPYFFETLSLFGLHRRYLVVDCLCVMPLLLASLLLSDTSLSFVLPNDLLAGSHLCLPLLNLV